MKLQQLLTAAAACGLTVALAAPVLAQVPAKPAATSAAAPAAVPLATGPSKIAIFNIEQAIQTTTDGKKAIADLNSRFAPKDAELQSSQKQIQALTKQLQDQGNTMSPTAKADMQTQLQSKERDYQQAAQNMQSDFQNAQAQLMNDIGGKIMPVVKKFAEDHGYTAVIDTSMQWPQNPVLYFSPATDITDEIIKLYDAEHPGTAAVKH